MVLILGATSDMALAFTNLAIITWSKCTFHLLARNTLLLHDIKTRAETLGHHVHLHTYDLLDPPEISFTGIEYYIAYAGWLPPNNNMPEITMQVNSLAIQAFTNKLFDTNRHTLEHIIVTGSVAGVRVRPSNKAYGMAKAHLHAWVKMFQKQNDKYVTSSLVIPGYVKTKMIAGHKTPGLLTTTPQKMAVKYLEWLITKPAVTYSQPVWQLIAIILQMLPGFVTKRLK